MVSSSLELTGPIADDSGAVTRLVIDGAVSVPLEELTEDTRDDVLL